MSLVSPKEGENLYLVYHDTIFGPFDQNFVSEGITIPFRSKLEALEQGTGIYHENDVVHSTIEGDFTYHPFVGGITPAPLPDAPNRIIAPAFDYRNNPIKIAADFGIATHKGTSLRYSSSVIIQIAYEKIDNLHWRFYEVWSSTSDPAHATHAYEYEIHLYSHYTSDYYYVYEYNKLYDPGTLNGTEGHDWSKQQAFSTIKSIYSQWASDGSKYVLGKMYRADMKPALSPSSARDKIDALVATLFPGEYPVEDKHYGDLAMEASQTVNANNTNMLEFLRDLRKPWEMIPKLSRLKNLKGVADNYLTVNYGLLPTVSDMKTIMEAFRRISPYFDRNGFKVYTAGVENKLVKDNITYTKIQRIKLAISDEDNDFQALLQRLESMGTLPTFENVWDLIPYSFVIDWFTDVGGFLERVDTHLRIKRLNIRYVTSSRKTITEGNLPIGAGAPFVGSVKWVQYHRWVSDQCPVPPLSLKTTYQDFDRWLESGALLVQRAK